VFFGGGLMGDGGGGVGWGGGWGGGGVLGGRDNRLCSLWYSIGLGVHGLWVSMFDVLWVLFGVVVLRGVFVASGFHSVCVCVCVCTWLGAFGVTTGEKKHFNKCERM